MACVDKMARGGANWNFILWGLYFCAFLCLEKAFLMKKLEVNPRLARVYLLFVVLASWALFAVTDFTRLGVLISTMFIPRGGDDWLYMLRNYGASIILAFFFATPALKKLGERLPAPVVTCFQLFVLFICVAYLVDSTNNFFLYFRF